MAVQAIAKERRTEKLNIRVSRSAKARLQVAAAASERKMSDFVMESALANRRIFLLDAEKWTAFQAALDAPVWPLPRLKALIEKPGFFSSGSTK